MLSASKIRSGLVRIEREIMDQESSIEGSKSGMKY